MLELYVVGGRKDINWDVFGLLEKGMKEAAFRVHELENTEDLGAEEVDVEDDEKYTEILNVVKPVASILGRIFIQWPEGEIKALIDLHPCVDLILSATEVHLNLTIKFRETLCNIEELSNLWLMEEMSKKEDELKNTLCALSNVCAERLVKFSKSQFSLLL